MNKNLFVFLVIFGVIVIAVGIVTPFVVQVNNKPASTPTTPTVTSAPSPELPKSNSDDDVKVCKAFQRLEPDTQPGTKDEINFILKAFRESESPALNEFSVLLDQLIRNADTGHYANELDVAAIALLAYDGCLSIGVDITEKK